jgi:hypothetical membrane protein
MKHSYPTLDLLLRFVVALEVFVYFGAALLHLGVQARLGSLVLAVPNTILPAAIVETILGLAVTTNLVALMRGNRRSKAITVGVHLFMLVGVSLGMVALALRVGPPPSGDWTIHYVMLAGIVAAMALILIRSMKRVERSFEPANSAARWLTLTGVVGPVLFVAVFTIAGLLRPGYSAIREVVSDLGRGPNAWIQNANFVIFGFMLIVFSISFYQSMSSVIGKRWLWISLLLFILSGIGFVAAAFFPVPSPSDPSMIRASQGILHMICFLAAIVPPIVALFIVGWQLRRNQWWSRLGWYSLITGAAALLLVVLTFIFANPDSPLQIGGLVVRILVLVLFAWHVVTGWQLFRLPLVS